MINGIFRVVDKAIGFPNVLFSYTEYQALLVTETVILGFTSVVVSGIALSMGALPKPPKNSEKNAN
jgi:hypothetical protein